MNTLQATYFDQNFSSTFYLHPEEAGLPAPNAAASASKSLQRLKRTPFQTPGSPAPRDRSSSERDLHHVRGASHSEHLNRADEQRTGFQEAEQDQQQQQRGMHSVLNSDEHADEQQQQEEMHLNGSHGHEDDLLQYEDAQEQAQAKQIFSLDRYFLPLKSRPNGQAKHATSRSPAQDNSLRGSPQEVGHTAMQLSNADAAGREIEDELLLTIEEQDQALR